MATYRQSSVSWEMPTGGKRSEDDDHGHHGAPQEMWEKVDTEDPEHTECYEHRRADHRRSEGRERGEHQDGGWAHPWDSWRKAKQKTDGEDAWEDTSWWQRGP